MSLEETSRHSFPIPFNSWLNRIGRTGHIETNAASDSKILGYSGVISGTLLLKVFL